MAYITFRGVDFRYGLDDPLIIRNFSLELERGELFTLVGPSGCGKTTVLHMLAGFESPSAGDLQVDARPVRGPERERIVIFQEPDSLYPWLTGLENVEFPLRVMGVPRAERRSRAEEALHLVGLHGHGDYMAAPDQIAALARNDIQAFFSWEPFVTRAQESVPNARILARAADDGLEFRGNVLMREDMAKNDRDTAIKVVKGLIETADWMSANNKEAAKVANEVLRAPTEEEVAKQLLNFKWVGDFKKSAKEQELKIAEWGVGIGLFPTKDAKALVDSIIYPDIIKAAAPNRTDM